MTYVDIVRTTGGLIQVRDASTTQVYYTLQRDVVMLFSNKYGGITLCDINGNSVSIRPEYVSNTQVEPAAAVPFSGSTVDLYKLMESDFVVNIVNPTAGGGGVNEANIINPIVNYLITTEDYIIAPTANVTLTLPATANDGQIYRIYSNGYDVTVDANVGQTIIGVSSVSLQNYDAIIVQYIKTNAWVII